MLRNIITKKSKPEITAALCVYNEELNIDGCLNHLEKYVDKIVIFDDASTDNTIKIAKKHNKVVKIITNKNKKSWQERNNRKILINTIYEISNNKTNAWVLCVDADERFEKNFLQRLRKIASSPKYNELVIAVHFRELWGDINNYRIDNVWGEKRKAIFFKLAPKMTFDYKQEHHIPWYYQELTGNEILLDYNLYHLKMVKKSDRQARADLYNKLDPKKKMQPIGYDYLTDTTGLVLEKIPKKQQYDQTTVSDYYK